MVNYINALRVAGSALNPASWAGKHAAAATLAGLIPVAVSFLPPQYAQYFDPTLVNGLSYGLATLLAALGVLGATDKVGVLPAKPAPVDGGDNAGQDNLSSGA